MKKILLLIFIGLIGASCENYLDEAPIIELDAETTFQSYDTFSRYLEYSYNLVDKYINPGANPAGQSWGDHIFTLADEAQVQTPGSPQQRTFTQGQWQNSNWKGWGLTGFSVNCGSDFCREPASAAMRGIRITNLALENFDKLVDVPGTNLYTPEQLVNQLKGQAYFLRGWHYFEIIRRYGGFIPMRKSFEVDTDFSSIDKMTYAASTDSLVSDLDRAIEFLPDVWDDNQKGRATKTTARAAKAMALLYAASPAMSAYDGGAYEYNTERANQAAVAAAEAIESYKATGGYYELYDWANYSENWYSRSTSATSEAILAPPQIQKFGGFTSGWGYGFGTILPGFDGGWGGHHMAPLQNAVDKFETIDGYAIEDAPATSFDPQDPYSRRDPRLRFAVYVNNDPMYVKTDARNRNLQAWAGGFHNKPELTQTGYIFKKLRWPGHNNQDQLGGYFKAYPLIRLPQLYLDFAEAANEAVGPNTPIGPGGMTAVDAINVVRRRATMPDVLALYTTDKETFRKRIRNERFVELIFEEHRFNDLRRWGEIHTLTDNIYVASIQKSGDACCVNPGDVFVYGKELLPGARRYTRRHEWFPYENEILNIMGQGFQTPGW